MTFRLTAAVAAVVIVIALVAAYLAGHQSPTANVPATGDPIAKAYKTMMRTDHAVFGASLSTNCSTVGQTGCAAALERIVPPLQKWISDIDAFKTTPQQFVVIGAQVRQHAVAALSAVNLAIAAVGAKDNPGLHSAINAGGTNATWLARATSAITETQQVKNSDYIALVKVDSATLNVCDGCQALAGSALTACTGAQADVCMSDLIPADDTIGQMEADVILQAAPSALTAKDQRLQTDLAAADSALLAMLNALLAKDVATFNAARAAYRQALAAINVDVTAITG